MKRKWNEGFSLVEVLVAMAILSIIVIPVCGSLVLSNRLNAKAEAVLQARLAVSSTVETLKATGIDPDNLPQSTDDIIVTAEIVKVNEGDVTIEAPYYHVVVTDKLGLVSVTTVIGIAIPTETGGGSTG